MKRRIIFVLALLCAAVASLHNVHAETLTVTNANDDGPGSLRWEIRNARSGDTIIFSVRGNIRIRSQLNIHQSISIEGPGRDKLAVDAFNGHLRTLRVFFVSGNPTALEPFNVTISGLTIKEGTVMPDSTGGFGAGIYNDNANLTVNDCTFEDNYAASGAGIFNGGLGTLTLENSTFLDNKAVLGGGIYNFANLTVRNCTISNNWAEHDGGGIYDVSYRGISVINSTISGNSAKIAGGIRSYYGSLTIGNTILNAGSEGANIVGGITSLGYNLCSGSGGGHFTGPGDKINTDPMLGPLADNGGPTLTQALLPGSPAINAGNPSFTPPPEHDQRGPGHRRVVNGRIDIGAFEVQ